MMGGLDSANAQYITGLNLTRSWCDTLHHQEFVIEVANHQTGDSLIFQSAFSGNVTVYLDSSQPTYKLVLTTVPGLWITLSVTMMRNNNVLSIIHLSQVYNSSCKSTAFPITLNSLEARRSGNSIFMRWRGTAQSHFEIYVDGVFDGITTDNHYTIKGSGTFVEVREVDVDGQMLSSDFEIISEMETDYENITHKYVPGKGWMQWSGLELETLLCTPTRKLWIMNN